MEQNDTALGAEVSLRVMAARLAAGLAQGLLLYWLYRAAREGLWPAGAPYLMTPLVMLGLMLPVVLISSLGHMAPRKTARWTLTAGLVLAVLALHDSWRAAGLAELAAGPIARPVRNAPSWTLLWFGAAFLYIAHALVMAGVQDRRRVATYDSYFEVAWKLAVQLLFSLFFVAALWAVLWMGAGLFELVRLTFFKTLLQRDWFYVPVICFAWSCAMHVTDVRPAIVRGIRTLLLVLSSWILPVAVLIICGFLCTLPFTGLQALWGTRHATSLLLTAMAMLILLINAAFQNGHATVALVIRVSARTAALLLLPLAGVAIYALGLRVHAYGWTVDRIVAAACLLVASCYALGYQWAAHQYDTWLLPIARINVWTAYVVLALIVALFTPIADPARLSVNSQLARLDRGRVTADKFDYAYLRFEGQRYGDAALRRMAAQGNARAAAALKLSNRWAPPAEAATAEVVTANLTVWPSGAALPAGFAAQAWREAPGTPMPPCLRYANQPCDAVLLDADGDGKQEVLLLGPAYMGGLLYGETAPGQWALVAQLPAASCDAVRDRLKAGRFAQAAPRWKALQVGGAQLQFTQQFSGADCGAVN
ncbi:hypothetical protein FHW58_000418 [Duganella sp. 1224]|uniref:DUF4153 domain-containing protein n=1 Tax=Duganella sp. 1224 TaxID=2587052 RepID=UPI0015C8E411|nr:DUF4153 domain-containing protein [Duganella sp. 1224]NYE59266.1 hypothetical protein [Duganella sp. 1224]